MPGGTAITNKMYHMHRTQFSLHILGNVTFLVETAAMQVCNLVTILCVLQTKRRVSASGNVGLNAVSKAFRGCFGFHNTPQLNGEFFAMDVIAKVANSCKLKWCFVRKRGTGI